MRLSLPKTILLLLVTALLVFSTNTLAQELYAGLDGHVKDPTGAVLSNATVEITGSALIGAKKMQTDASGYFRFANLPPGSYTLTVTAKGFRTHKQAAIGLVVGRFPTIEVAMQIGTTAETVEVSAAAPLIDTTQSKVQTVLTQEALDAVPKGASYQSLIQFAPGARYEPMQAPTQSTTALSGNRNGIQNAGNGFQIDGASNTENSYMIEGMETASVFDGASAANMPTEFIQELQIKTSGFEAEHGGSLGGVVNVIQKHGTNNWHGAVFTQYQGDAFDAAPAATLRNDPQSKANVPARTDLTPQYYQVKKDHYRYVQPGVEIGGPLLKDRLWGFVSTAPSFMQVARSVNFQSSTFTGTRTFHPSVNTYYSLARVDFLATQKIRLFGSWQYGYERGTGTSLPARDSAYDQYNPARSNNPDNYNSSIGYVAPNVIYGTGADITLSPNLIATTRFGYFYQDYQDRGKPTGIRTIYQNPNYPNSTANVTNATAAFVGLDGTSHIPSQFINSTGWSNIGDNRQTAFDKIYRWSFNQDLAYFKRALGTHNLKVGYGFSRNRIDTQSAIYNTAYVMVAYGVPYTPRIDYSINTSCPAIIGQNVAKYGAGAASNGCQGLFGTIDIRDYGQFGDVMQWNHALYLQDAWNIGHGVTINAGLRTEKENIPSFDPRAGFSGVSFNWTQKMAPRLGAAWDVRGNGKIKVYGSFGYFYQVMNLQLPRGQWGGNYWHDCVYALDVADFTSIIPQRDSGGHYCPRGGSTPAVGSFPANGLRFIENYDFRAQANDPKGLGSLGPSGRIDPNLDPMKQHEMVLGADFELKRDLGLELRYSRKRLDRAIEDAGVIFADGEMYYDVNPGYNFNSTIPSWICNGCQANPPAVRNYDGLETRVTYRGAGKWSGSASYTYSRYYGNYAGLTSTDQADSNLGGGRNGANSDRAFDEPYMSFDSHGKAINGPLSTDRPHTFKAQGYYRLKWWGMETRLGGFQQLYSGTPLSSYVSIWGAPVYVEGRGNFVDVTRDASGNWVLNGVSARRTPRFSQTDLNLVHSVHVSKTNERLVTSFEVNVLNVFNQHSKLDYNSNLISTSGAAAEIHPSPCTAGGCLSTNPAPFDYKLVEQGFNYIGLANTPIYDKNGNLLSNGATLNAQYGMPYLYQNPRSFRFKIKFSF